ncbi:hypothetical protein FRC06_006147 [Ceratobasidium sp. 370]|nr:hypothetical protein FRC06_006147 [Ceratobasidium sp. 370]
MERLNTLGIEQQRAYARTVNLNGLRGNRALMPLPRNNGELPQGFPETLDVFRGMTGVQINVLLGAYDQPVNGLVEERRVRLACFIGINHD